jgi:hypothetical protein
MVEATLLDARTGSIPSCAELANHAKERWREDGSLPATLRDLRSCMFSRFPAHRGARAESTAVRSRGVIKRVTQ